MSLHRESKIRGLHAFGYFCQWKDRGEMKSRTSGWRKAHSLGELAGTLYSMSNRWPEMYIGHNRYSTSGDWRDHKNNQPLIAGGKALVFNGVIHMGTKEQMEAEFNISLATDNDGEVFLRHSIVDSPAKFVEGISGSFAGVWIEPETGEICALRNERRPLWAVVQDGYVAVASTRDIVERALGPDAAANALELPENERFTFEQIRTERPQARRSQQSSRLSGLPPSYGGSGRYRSRLSAPAVPRVTV